MTDEARPVRESFFAEVLMSVIIATSLLSCLLMFRAFNEFVTITAYPQMIPLILTGIHVIIRRKINKLFPCFILHVLSSAAFFFAVIMIPFTGFGENLSNEIYLAIIITVFTIFSFSYRLNPTILPSDSQVVAIPACVFPIFGLFYVMMDRPVLIHNLVGNTIFAVALYIIMRQVAVFDAKYYHAIRSSSRAPEQLRKQNYKTTICLVGIFILSLLIVRFVPVEAVSNIVRLGILAFLRFIVPLFFAIIDFIAGLIKDISTEEAEEAGEMPELEEVLGDERWLRVLSIIIAILILIGVALLIINSIRLLIQNAPKYGKEKESTNDGIVTDTIEDIKPEKISRFRRKPDFGKGDERRIRKKFYDKTVKAMRKGLPVSGASTPGQIEKVLTENGDREFTQLRKEYEKIRYGN